MTPFELRRRAERMGVLYRDAVKMRCQFLIGRYSFDTDCPVENALAQRDLDEIIVLMESLKRRKVQPTEDAITDEMINRARNYPIDRLVEFDRRGNALAWCHADSNPSLHHHKDANRAHCWACDKSFDPIAVLMDRDGLAFRDAVRALAR